MNNVTVNSVVTLHDTGLGNPAAGYLQFNTNQTLGGSGTVSFAGSNSGNALYLPNNGTTLTIAPGFTVSGTTGIIGDNANATVVNEGTINASDGGKITVQAGIVIDQDNIDVANGSTLDVEGDLTVDGQGTLSTGASSVFDINGNLLGNTTDDAGFNPLGSVVFDSATGTSNPPQLPRSNVPRPGETSPPGSATISLTGTLNLTPGHRMSSSSTTQPIPLRDRPEEALYVEDLVVPAGATLNLAGLHLYAQTEQIAGTLISGGAVVTGEVYDDADKSGTLTPGELGLAGWTIELTDSVTDAVYTTLTDANGMYTLFERSPPAPHGTLLRSRAVGIRRDTAGFAGDLQSDAFARPDGRQRELR